MSRISSICPKCGHRHIAVEYHAGERVDPDWQPPDSPDPEAPEPPTINDCAGLYNGHTPATKAEHLHRFCARCQYEWTEPTLTAGAT